MTKIEDKDEKPNPQVSRRETLGLGSAALAAVLAAARTKNASAAPQDSNALAHRSAPNETDPGPQNIPLAQREPRFRMAAPNGPWLREAVQIFFPVAQAY
jgi:hypothetical protein